MKKCSSCKVEKDFSEFTKYTSSKDGLSSRCRDCSKRSCAAYKLKNKDKIKEYNAKSYAENKEYHILKAKRWQALNPEKYTKSNRVSRKKWAAGNLDKIAAKQARRRALILKATPSWLTQEQLDAIVDFYTIARMFKMYTGEEYHVDHIVPLQGKKVCGLHVPWNLQVLHAKDNLRKSNKLQELNQQGAGYTDRHGT